LKGGIGLEGAEHFIIRDNSTGIEYDIRNQPASLLFTEAKQRLTLLPNKTCMDPWEDWWKKRRHHINKFVTAAEKGQIEVIADLLNTNKYGDLTVDINTKGLDGYTSLHYAVSEKQIDTAKYLLKSGADVNCVTDSLRTPLHIACNKGEIELMKVLVVAGADINAQDKDGNTPMHILSELGYIECVKWLLSKEPDLNIKNKCGVIVFEIASTVEIRQIFTQCGKLKVNNNYSRTVMNGIVLYNNRADTVKSLIFKVKLIESESRLRKRNAKITTQLSTRKVNSLDKSRIEKILQATEKMKTTLELKDDNIVKEEIKGDIVTSNDFDIINLIGKGSFAQVYLVKYKKNNKLYAMKVLDKKMIISKNSMRYIKTEKNVMRITKHPFIVKLHSAFQNNYKLFMIMQYCPG